MSKSELHPRNKHKEGYDMQKLVLRVPALQPFIKKNPSGVDSIDWSDSKAVLLLNKALLLEYYKLQNWSIPPGFLCPPVPGRADYVHYVADLLASENDDQIPTGKGIKIFDLGVGANCIYPIIGAVEYGWRFVGVESNPRAFKSAKGIVAFNDHLRNKVEIRQQLDPSRYNEEVIRPNEFFDALMCNPPFYSSVEEAEHHNQQKQRNLKPASTNTSRNFGGQSHELVTTGGELAFIQGLIEASALFPTRVFWYTTLVSSGRHLNVFYKQLKELQATEYKTIEMKQGNKISRCLAWTFLRPAERKKWKF